VLQLDRNPDDIFDSNDEALVMSADFYLTIAAAMRDNTEPPDINKTSRTELDSHANMPVVG